MLPAQTGAEISAPAPALPEFIPGPQPTEPDPGVIVPTTPTLTSEPAFAFAFAGAFLAGADSVPDARSPR